MVEKLFFDNLYNENSTFRVCWTPGNSKNDSKIGARNQRAKKRAQMKPGGFKVAARGRLEAPSWLQRGSLGGTFALNGVPLATLAIGTSRPLALLVAENAVLPAPELQYHKNWHEIPHIQVTNSAPCSESGPFCAAPRGSAA